MLTIIAGPCSIGDNNLHEVEEILSFKINGKKAVAGTRVVGLKSRTAYNNQGDGLGMDYQAFNENLAMLINGESSNNFVDLPSVLMAKKLQQQFNCIIATEIMDPSIQMPILDRHLKGTVMPWNPSVNALGWGIYHMSKYCEKNNWLLGFKNPKNLGITIQDSEQNGFSAPMEKVWKGLTSYSQLPNENKILIHRGVDSEIKSLFRNDLVHRASERTKFAIPNIKLFFDPSHSYGPKLRDQIVDGTIEAIKLKDHKGDYLYDGILVEVGTSITDTDQHITVAELKEMIKRISDFRDIG